ncbi:MAG: alpha/beta hydrolase [Pseudomonadota bacterium]
MHFRLFRLSILSCVLVFFFTPLHAKAGVEKDIAYGALDLQRLDVYSPRRASGAPVMIFVHGGGWQIGDKKRVHRKPAAFKAEGFVFVSVGYPLLPDHAVETQAQSVAMAIAWVAKNIADYGGDPSQLHLMGHSAGAHLAALSAFNPKYLQEYGVKSESIRSFTSVDGVTLDISWRMQNLDQLGPVAGRMFENAFGDNPVRWKKLSPSHYIRRKNHLPPSLFLLAEEGTGSRTSAEQVASRIRQAGGAASVLEIAGKSHASINREMGQRRDKAFDDIIAFIGSPGRAIRR